MSPLFWQLPLYMIGAGLVVYAVNWLGLIGWRRAVAAHWTERARLLWPVRTSAALNLLLVPVGLGCLHSLLVPEAGVWCGLVVLAAWLGAMLGSWPLDHEMFPELAFPAWVRQACAAWILRFGFQFLPLAGAWIMPPEFGWATLLIAAPLLANHLWANFGGLVQVLRWLGLVVPAGGRLQSIVQATSARMNVRVRHTWALESISVQAFALPATGDLIFTNRLVEISTDEEVAVVCAHELAHLSESRTTLAGRIIGSLSVYPLVLVRPLAHTFGPVGPMAVAVAVSILVVLRRKLYLRMERRADGLAVANEENAGVYARALEKLYRANQVPAVNGKRVRSHPHLYDRMLAAGITPDYPRPAAPKSATVPGQVLSLILFGLIGAVVAQYFERAGGN